MSKSLIVKDNIFIESRCRLTEYEAKLLTWCAAQIEPEDQDFRMYTLTRLEAIRLLGFDSNLSLKRIEAIIDSLFHKSIKLKDPERLGKNGWEEFHLITKARYNSNEETYSFSLSSDLKPYFLQLRKNFTKLDFSYLIGFKHIHSFRIYELCKMELRQNVDTYFERSIEEIKLMLGISGKYKKFKDFKKKVLNLAIEELKKAALDVTIIPSRFNSREYKILCFNVKMIVPEHSGVYLQLRSFGLKKEKILKILEDYLGEIIKTTLKKWGSQIGEGKFNNGVLIKNKAGVFLDKLKLESH